MEDYLLNNLLTSEELPSFQLLPDPVVCKNLYDDDSRELSEVKIVSENIQVTRKKQKRKRMWMACVPCIEAKVKCDATRPCSRCVKRETPHDCVDKERIRVKKPTAVHKEIALEVVNQSDTLSKNLLEMHEKYLSAPRLIEMQPANPGNKLSIWDYRPQKRVPVSLLLSIRDYHQNLSPFAIQEMLLSRPQDFLRFLRFSRKFLDIRTLEEVREHVVNRALQVTETMEDSIRLNDLKHVDYRMKNLTFCVCMELMSIDVSAYEILRIVFKDDRIDERAGMSKIRYIYDSKSNRYSARFRANKRAEELYHMSSSELVMKMKETYELFSKIKSNEAPYVPFMLLLTSDDCWSNSVLATVDSFLKPSNSDRFLLTEGSIITRTGRRVPCIFMDIHAYGKDGSYNIIRFHIPTSDPAAIAFLDNPSHIRFGENNYIDEFLSQSNSQSLDILDLW